MVALRSPAAFSTERDLLEHEREIDRHVKIVDATARVKVLIQWAPSRSALAGFSEKPSPTGAWNQWHLRGSDSGWLGCKSSARLHEVL
jgi:hypothetical protein